MSHGVDFIDQYRRAAVLNMRTAKALGVTVPPMLSRPRDEVIE